MPKPWFDGIRNLTHRTAQRLRVRSALNPMLWLCAVVTPTFLYTGYKFQTDTIICMILIIAGLIPPAITCIGFIGFAIFKPDKLQSEDYQIRHEMLQLVQQKSGRLEVDPVSLEAIPNPERRLISGEGENKC